MRKLVKKLALVLALVLAFACFAPASAQAAEVRRSWNFAVGEFKPTLEMEVGENFALELLDNGDTINADIYDVAYYSKSEALEVNKATGYAVAKAAEDDVRIAAVVTNKVAGRTDKIWAFVDIAAKEVVATPTATEAPTATPTATPVPTKAPFALVDAKQISKTEIALTFNDDAKNVTRNDLEIKYATKANATGKINSFIKGISTKANVVTVTLYKEMKDDNYMFVSYKDGAEKSFQVSVGEVASIEILTTNVKADMDNGTPLKVEAYDENGIILFNGKLAELADGEASYELTFAEESNIEDDIAFADVSDADIFFFEEGKTAVVELIYYTGSYDEETGEYDKVYAHGYITSIDTTYMAEGKTFAIYTDKAIKDVKFTSNTLYVGDKNYYVEGILNIIKPQLDGTFKTETGYAHRGLIDWNGDKDTADTNVNGKDETVQAITYETCDSSIVLVDPNTGLVTGIQKGTADIIVKFVDTIDEETGDVIEGDVIGICEVKVDKARVMDEVRIKTSITRVISTAKDANDSAVLEYVVEDQYNAGYSYDDYKLVQLNYLDNEDYTQFSETEGGFWTCDESKNKITFKGYNSESVKDGTYRFKLVVTAADGTVKESPQFTVRFKEASEKASNYKLEGLPTSFDVKVQKSDKLAGKKTLSLNAYDASGLKIKTVAVEGFLDKDNKEVEDGSFWLEVTVPEAMSVEAKAEFLASGVTISDGKVVFNPFKQKLEGEELIGWTLGKYTLTVWKFNATTQKYSKVGSQATASTTLSNGQQTLSVALADYTSDERYSSVVELDTVGKVHTVTGGALVDVLVNYAGDDTGCLKLMLNGSEVEIAETAANDKTTIKSISYVTDGKKYVSITEVVVVYQHAGVEATIKTAVEGITVELATE